jgi:hypothetical protein
MSNLSSLVIINKILMIYLLWVEKIQIMFKFCDILKAKDLASKRLCKPS